VAVRLPVTWLRPVACEPVDRGDGALICDYCRGKMFTNTERDNTDNTSPDAVPVCPGDWWGTNRGCAARGGRLADASGLRAHRPGRHNEDLRLLPV
jgi:hypothetical protein